MVFAGYGLNSADRSTNLPANAIATETQVYFRDTQGFVPGDQEKRPVEDGGCHGFFYHVCITADPYYPFPGIQFVF